jgi:hypothetical protein
MVLSAPSESVRSECESADRLRGKVADRLPPEMEGIAAGPLLATAVAEFLLPNSSESALNTLSFSDNTNCTSAPPKIFVINGNKIPCGDREYVNKSARSGVH